MVLDEHRDAGSLGDRYGRRKVFLIGVLWFGAASALCGLAQSTEMLVAARVLQGVGGEAPFAATGYRSAKLPVALNPLIVIAHSLTPIFTKRIGPQSGSGVLVAEGAAFPPRDGDRFGEGGLAEYG